MSTLIHCDCLSLNDTIAVKTVTMTPARLPTLLLPLTLPAGEGGRRWCSNVCVCLFVCESWRVGWVSVIDGVLAGRRHGNMVIRVQRRSGPAGCKTQSRKKVKVHQTVHTLANTPIR